MSKSYVTLETRKCLICCRDYNTGSIIMDRQMRELFDTNTCTGWGMCQNHQKDLDNGLVAIIECDESKSVVTNGRVKPKDAHRTGRVVSCKLSLIQAMLPDADLPDGTPLIMLSQASFNKLIPQDVYDNIKNEVVEAPAKASADSFIAPGTDQVQ